MIRCPKGHAPWGVSEALGPHDNRCTPVIWPIFPQGASDDGVPRYGARKATQQRGRLARRTIEEYAEASRALGSLRRISLPAFDTWCRTCGDRFRIDVAARPPYRIGEPLHT